MTGTRDDQALSNFANQNVFMYSLFLLICEANKVHEVDGVDALRRFAAWFVIEGRHVYAVSAVIDRTLIEALSRSDEQRCHALMRHLARRSGVSLHGTELRTWYLRDAVPQFKLAPFLGEHEVGTYHSYVGERNSAAFNASSFQVTSNAELVSYTRTASFDGRDHEAAPTCDCARPTVSIVGFHRSVMGIGEDARSLFECFLHIGVSAELVDVSPPGLELLETVGAYAPYEAKRPTGSVVIFCMPAFEMMDALAKLNLTPARYRYLIGYWPWETTSLPPIWDHVYDFVDEIWASSQFLKQVYTLKTAKPVTHVPLHVRVESKMLIPELREIFEGTFTFLTVFDFNSHVARKNPQGAIDAFIRAFPKGANRAQLVIKTLHGHHRPSELAHIVARARQDGRIIVIDGPLSRADICAMIWTADAYVSLHRAEGFGRPIAEAMMLETPVVATAWSGSADFLNTDTGYPVASNLRPVRAEEYPFAAGSWAEPDTVDAATQMRAVFDDQDRAIRIQRAKALVEARFARAPIAANLASQLQRIQGLLQVRKC